MSKKKNDFNSVLLPFEQMLIYQSITIEINFANKFSFFLWKIQFEDGNVDGFLLNEITNGVPV